MSEMSQVLIAGDWRDSDGAGTFENIDPHTGRVLGTFPITSRRELDEAFTAGWKAWTEVYDSQEELIPTFLERFGDRIEERAEEIVETAHRETALPREPRLADVELHRTTDQLRQAARAARERSWKRPTVNTANRIASVYEGIPGVVCVFGPNNFPLAFNCISGGDFAAAIATGHPVIGKANPGHPGTTMILAEEARAAVADAGLPEAFIQLVYSMASGDGMWLVADHRVAATAYTGSRRSGLALKEAAEKAGNLIYLELSSVNPVIILPEALHEGLEDLATEFADSMLTGEGQLCTSPGLLFTIDGPNTADFRNALGAEIESRVGKTLLTGQVQRGLEDAERRWREVGARPTAKGKTEPDAALTYPPTVMEVSGSQFVENSSVLQTEAFGGLSLFVSCADMDELLRCIGMLEGSLTGSVYASSGESPAYESVARALRPRVGRLLNDKMPTGVAVVPAMNHGGPYPSTGHPGFTAVGIPASLERFAMLQCYDNVPDERLPPELEADNPLGHDRYVDGVWMTEPVT